MDIQFVGLPTAKVSQAKSAGRDAYDQPIEVHTSTGEAYPCRHCLGETPTGQTYLVLAWKPFETANPYAETGPIFLCQSDCKPLAPSSEVPATLRSAQYLVRGYGADERILYGTGRVVETRKIPDYARQLLEDPTVAFVDVRSAANNCFQCRVLRI